jgi:hypothetical protein
VRHARGGKECGGGGRERVRECVCGGGTKVSTGDNR